MSSKIINICDRCGKEYGNAMTHTLIYYQFFRRKELDLCHDCYHELLKFVTDGKKEAANGSN